MEYIEITSQKQLDELPLDYSGRIYIKFGTPDNRAVVRHRYKYPVEARGNSIVTARDNSSVTAWGNSSVSAWDNSSVAAFENSIVEARGNSSVTAWENSSVEARENSSVAAWGNSSVEARGNTQVVAASNTAAIQQSGNARIVHMPRTISKYLEFYEIENDGETAKLYKAVHKIGDIYRSDYTSGCTYAPGETTEADALDKDPDETCGHGIHMAHLDWCLDYGSNWSDLAIIEVETEIDGIIVPRIGDGKVRAARCKMIREVPLEECGVYGKILAKRRSNA